MVPTLGLCSPSPSPAGPTAAAVRGTHSPECPNHPQERSPRTGGDGEKQGRGVRPLTPMHTISRHADKLRAVSKHCPCRPEVYANVLSRWPRLGHMGFSSSHLYIHIHTRPLQRRQSQVLGPQILPNPRKQPPRNYFPERTGQALTHLGKLGNAPGPVRCRPTVGGPSGPGPSPLHGPQRAQFQAPRRRLGRAGERLVFRQLAEGPLSGAGVFVQICLLWYSFTHSTNQQTH